MPRTVLREFTGGLSSEIDPQNLRQDQGEEALDINLKGFALEPGEGTAPISGGHYYYRGEWITDSKAVSFEESGIGVVKTFNDKRPEVEEIIKDDVNTSRSLGPPLPPTAVVSGTVVSEGTRGERPAEGAHLLKLPETALGEVDEPDGNTPAPSLETYEADSTTIIDDIHYYNGQAYWLVKPISVNWVVKTRAWNSDLAEFTSSDITSTSMPHNSKGYFFKGGYFVCWDNQYIDSVALSYTSMSSVDTINTVDPADNGDGGSAFLPNAGKTASTNFTTGASSAEITGVDIDQNGLITFSQRMTTANTFPTAYEDCTGVNEITGLTTVDNDDERWFRTPTDSSEKGCFLVLLRDGLAEPLSDAYNSGVASTTDAGIPSVFTTKIGATEALRDIFPGWTVPKSTIVGVDNDPKYQHINLSTSMPFGIKYAVMFVENDSWIRVRYNAPVVNPPEVLIIPHALQEGSYGTPAAAIAAIKFYAILYSQRAHVGATGKEYQYDYPFNDSQNRSQYTYRALRYISMKDRIQLTLEFPSLPSKGRKIWYEYIAPTGNITNFTLSGLENVDIRGSSCRFYNGSYPGVRRSYPGLNNYNYFELGRLWLFNVAPGAGVAGTLLPPIPSSANATPGSWKRTLGNRVSHTHASWAKNTTWDAYRNNITTPVVPGKMHRLCSYVRGGATTQQGAFSVSELWTTAKFASADNSISFKEATTKNFRVGDWIKIGQNGTNKSMHLNLRGDAQGSDSRNTQGEQTFITAKILSIVEGVKLLLSPPGIDHSPGNVKKYIDEDCYPVISGFISHIDYKYNTIYKNGSYIRVGKGFTTDSTTGPTCSLIKSDLLSHVLVGHGYGRTFFEIPSDYSRYGTRDLIEVRAAGGVQVPTGDLINNCHRVSWSSSRDEIRGAGTITAPRLYYTRGGRLYSQAGNAGDTAAKPISLGANGGYHVDDKYLTHFDGQGVTVYTPDLLSTPYIKGNPTLSDGLGLTGNITDARTFVDTYNAVYVYVKIGDYWKFVKTSNTGPETSLLSYDFKKPIGFDNTKVWGISSDSAGGWDIQYATPFYESNIKGSWVFFANNYGTVTPTETAWGQVVNSRIGEKGNNGTPRYLSVDWKMDSGDWFGTGDPTIGLNHEANKMIEENIFKWYPVDIPSSLVTSGTATVIADIPDVVNTYRPLASVEVLFKSRVYRDIVFFKEQETLLPVAGETGGESKISFVNYADASQSFYTLNDNVFKIVAQHGKEPERAFRLGQALAGGTAFDNSKLGISTFLIGAPNMFNAYGANIDLYYRASFVNKWGHESAPSPLSSSGVTALDSADDCVQVNFNAPFFRFTDTDIDTIRLYRYGADSSEFLFLKDIPMPTLPVDSDGARYFPTISGINSITNGFARKSSISPYYILKTNKDISSLSGFTNSNFLLTATPSSLDGSWRVNQLSENSSPSVAYTTTLAEDLNTTDTTVKLTNAANPSAWPASGMIKLGEEYISYAAISSSDLTGCVRGIHGTSASDHKSGSAKALTVSAGGSNFGHDDGSGGFSSADVTAESFTNPSSTNVLRLGLVSNTLVPLAEGMPVVLKTTGTLPSVLSLNTIYYVTNKTLTGNGGWELSNTLTVTSATFTATSVGNVLVFTTVGHTLVTGDRVGFTTTGTLPENITAAGSGTGGAGGAGGIAGAGWFVVSVSGDDFRVSQFLGGGQQTGTGLGSGTMTWTKVNGIKADVTGGYGTDVGSGTPSYNGCIIHSTGGGGTGFCGAYGVNTSTGAITSVDIVNGGQGYTSSPTLVISDPGLAGAGAGGTLAITMDAGDSANVIEWELEMEHRNQDTTTLTEALPVLTGTANIVNVTDTSVFPIPSTKTFTASSDAGLLITSNAHGLNEGELITVSSTTTLPTGLIIDTNYYVKYEDANTFRLALTNGGTAIAYTNAGSGTHSMLILPKILIGSEILAYTGKTTFTFTGVTPGIKGTIASTHGLNVIVRSYDENYATTTVTNASIEIEGFGFRDKARTPIGSLYDMGLDNYPPLGLEYNVKLKQFFETESEDDYFRYIKAVGSMYFGALDANLRFSKYGSPEYWPLDAVITLDSEIRCIEEHAGEGLVFTTNSVYRVRGTDPKAMVAFRVPDARGLPAGYEHTVSDFNGGLIWLTASDGICMYSAGRASYLTRDKHNIGKLKAPYSCVVDGTYWLFQEPGGGEGYRLELATGEMRLAQTTIEAYYAYFAKALGAGVVVTKDNTINPDRDSEFLVEEIGGAKVNNIKWKSKKIDAGEPAIPKALGSIAIVYEALNSTNAETIVSGIRGQALAAQLLGLDPEDLDAGDIASDESETITDLYSIFTKYDEPNQTYIVDTDGANLTNTERRTILMPVGFNTSSVTVGDRVWNELLADNTVVESLTTTTISGVVYPSIVLNNEPLRSGQGTIYWGTLPMVEIYLNNDDTPSRVFTLPPGDIVEPQSMDLYLNDLKRFRTISVAIQGDVRVQALSLRHYPLQRYQSSTLHHSADVFYKGDIDFRIMLDGSLVYRKELNNAGDDFTEERIYFPASSFGQRAHYMNESRTGMIESVNFNGSVAA